MFSSSEDSCWRENPSDCLSSCRVDHGGQQRLKPGLRKCKLDKRSLTKSVLIKLSLHQEVHKQQIHHTCLIRTFLFFFPSDFTQLELDENSMSRNLKLSNNNRKVTHVKEEQPYPDHPDRFHVLQLLCRNVLRDRCYWEVEWSGSVNISVSYSTMERKRGTRRCTFGQNHQSWSLECSGAGYYVCHKGNRTVLSPTSSSSSSGRVGVYVDCPAGSLSFFRVSSDSLIHLYTFNTTFTQPLHAGFRLWFPGSSVSLCPL
uniref:B30.2/SPRY domain-containing protein n=1 Tax=Salarias fasciatus TaxID=181472 RepID=A0A672HMN2_SALFA